MSEIVRACSNRGPDGLPIQAGTWPAFTANGLPAVVGEGLVGFRHFVRVFALLDRATLVLRSRQQLVGELLGEGVVRALTRVKNDPANRECVATVGANLDRHLVVGAADTT